MEFLVSVIIPVYNAERFIIKAIQSAIEQPEVLEVVVVNDGSTDGTLTLLNYFKESNPNANVRIYHHNNKINKGRSASRNLGITRAKGNYIAFLDADDYYLRNRFKNDKFIFKENIEVDGVYNAIGVHFYRESNPLEEEKLRLTTVTEYIEPCELFDALFYYKKGHFSIDGLTVKRSIFEKIGYFNEALKVAEDTELFFRMALKCKLVTGIIDKALAMRGVHYTNVFNREDLYKISQIKMYESLFFWTGKNKIKRDYVDLILKRIWLIKYKENKGIIKAIQYWIYLFLKNIKYLFSTLSIKYFPIVRLRQKLFPFLYNNNRI